MKISSILYLIVLLWQVNAVNAQQEKGQITINAGVGHSPEFDGNLDFGGGPTYPAGINSMAENEGFGCSSIIPAINLTADYNLTSKFSLGLATSYQRENVAYISPYNSFDKITRINLAGRMLIHLDKVSVHFDPYFGIRFGLNYWGDAPPPNPGYPTTYFLTSPNSFAPSFQVLFGMRVFLTTNIGIHFELGIGEPYIAEGGLTFRVGNQKPAAAQNAVPGQPKN